MKGGLCIENVFADNMEHFQAAMTKRTNEYVYQDMRTQTGMQIWRIG